MTRTINTLAVAALTLTLAAPIVAVQSNQGPAKIATIDSEVILERIPGRAEIEAALKKEVDPANAKIKAMEDSNVAMRAAYDKDSPTLSAEAKASRQKAILDKNAAWGAKVDSINAALGRRKQALEAPMTAILKKVLDDIRAEEGYWMIIDIQAAGPMIVAIDKNMDITDRVLARYKTAAPASPAKAGAPTGSGGAPVNTGTGVGGVKPPPSPEP